MDEKESREHKKKELQKLYFELGTGLFDSQTLEYDIRFLIYILTDLGIIDIDPIKAEEISNGITKHTIGGLIKIIRDKTLTKETQDEFINLGIDARNKLIHHYMMDNIERIVSIDERKKMVIEIRDLRKEIQKADRVIKHPDCLFGMNRHKNSRLAKFSADREFCVTGQILLNQPGDSKFRMMV